MRLSGIERLVCDTLVGLMVQDPVRLRTIGLRAAPFWTEGAAPVSGQRCASLQLMFL
jgi:hypothetical protein